MPSHESWACYHSELLAFDLDEFGEIGVIGCAVGASFAVLVAEQLFASGCEFLISVTSAGQIPDHGPTPYFVLIDRALRDEGTSYHYLPPSIFAEAPEPGLLYKWLRRYAADGQAGRAKLSPAYFPSIEGKCERRDPDPGSAPRAPPRGVKRLRNELIRLHGLWLSPTTIHKVLTRHGFIAPAPFRQNSFNPRPWPHSLNSVSQQPRAVQCRCEGSRSGWI
jgi:hypothetical protein